MSIDAAVKFMSAWQEMAGAIIGGLFSLWVALLVARDARNREDRTAATLLVVTLTNLVARHAALVDLERSQSVPQQDHHKWLSEKLSKSGPRLSPLAEAALARLLPVDAVLAAHLELFRTLHGELEIHIERIVQDFRDLHEHGKSLRSTATMEADAKNATSAFEGAAKHAGCAVRLLEFLVLSRFPTWHRVRMRVCPSRDELACQALRKGVDA